MLRWAYYVTFLVKAGHQARFQDVRFITASGFSSTAQRIERYSARPFLGHVSGFITAPCD